MSPLETEIECLRLFPTPVLDIVSTQLNRPATSAILNHACYRILVFEERCTSTSELPHPLKDRYDPGNFGECLLRRALLNDFMRLSKEWFRGPRLVKDEW
jgi:hypothetical protein